MDQIHYSVACKQHEESSIESNKTSRRKFCAKKTIFISFSRAIKILLWWANRITVEVVKLYFNMWLIICGKCEIFRWFLSDSLSTYFKDLNFVFTECSRTIFLVGFEISKCQHQLNCFLSILYVIKATTTYLDVVGWLFAM